jgi:type VI secretion system VasI family protein
MSDDLTQKHDIVLRIQNAALYVVSAFLLLSALFNLSDSILAALIIAAAAVILPPIAVPQIPTRFRAAIAFILFLCGAMLSNSAGVKKTALEQEKTAHTVQDMIQKADARLLEDFHANPDKVLKSITEYVDAKNYTSAKGQIEPLLAANDPRITDLHDKVLSLIAEQEKAREAENVQRQKEEEEKRQADSWMVFNNKSDMDDSEGIMVVKKANASISVWLKEVTPQLLISCGEHKTKVVFVADTSFTPVYGEYDMANIRMRIDDEKAVLQLWEKTINGEAAFSPSAISLLQKIQGAKILRIQFEAFNSGVATAEFDVRGLKPHLEEVAKTCHWKL